MELISISQRAPYKIIAPDMFEFGCYEYLHEKTVDKSSFLWWLSYFFPDFLSDLTD